jgi:glycosyltransferase involved in cell wall biosynthesis
MRPRILLTTEGTYPFHPGGVSTWCDTLVHRLTDFEFVVFAVAMNPYVSIRFAMPENVREVVTVPLWGVQDPSEYRTDLDYTEVFLKKQRTSERVVEDLFLPLLDAFLGALLTSRPERQGETLAAMYRYFQTYDYLVTFKAASVWERFRTWVVEETRAGNWDEATVYEAVQALGWLYHFLIVLNMPLPEVDLVHSSAAAFCGIPGVVGKLERGTPYVLTEHGVYLREQYLAIGRSNMSPFARRFLLAMVRTVVETNLFYADEIAPVCAFNARWERRLGAPAGKIRVLYNGVDPERFSPRPLPPRDAPTVLSVARVDPNKDLATLLEALALLRRRGIALRAVVQGAVAVEAYYEEMLRLRGLLGLEGVVEFRGHSADMPEVYRQADVVVQSSLTEAFPYSVLEAMMSGVPVVATDVGGTREAIGDTGVLVPARDPARLAVGLLSLLVAPERRQELGRRARRRALERFTVGGMVARLGRTYRAWLGRHTAADEAVLLVTKGLLLARLGEVEAALRVFEEALRVASWQSAPVLLGEIARLELRRGREGHALYHLVRARLLEELGRRRSA